MAKHKPTAKTDAEIDAEEAARAEAAERESTERAAQAGGLPSGAPGEPGPRAEGGEGAFPERASDGLPTGGNRDDAAELDMGLRTEEMGDPPGKALRGEDEPETLEEENARLRRELEEARRGLAALVPEEAMNALVPEDVREEVRGVLQKRASEPARAGGAAETLPGEGPVVWQGHIHKNDLFHARKPFRFRGTESEAEAREAFLKLNKIRGTTGKVVVSRVSPVQKPVVAKASTPAKTAGLPRAGSPQGAAPVKPAKVEKVEKPAEE